MSKSSVEGTSSSQKGITQLFITKISPEQTNAYRKWLSKIHSVEEDFPGFQGMFVQAPTKKQDNWITFLQFDTQENLDRWLTSPERQKILLESEAMVMDLESHRVHSPFAGWFRTAASGENAPSVWKQSMLILLVLFPTVMLELKFLPLLTRGMNIALATFISNAISVSLLAWPMLPLTIRLFSWWLSSTFSSSLKYTFMGTLLVIALYLIEIAIFWKFI